MRIAVTGAAGRLGRHVVTRALRAGHEVIAGDLPAAFARRGPAAAFTALRLHAVCGDHTEARERCDDERTGRPAPEPP
jgi:nucleoside-diphosphate-sugar epimerase